MFPVLPSQSTPELDELVLSVLKSSAELGKGLHPLILETIADLMTQVNSYYTNAMEGNPSTLKDIEAALRRHFNRNRTSRNYQMEHLAHMEVQELIRDRVHADRSLNVCSLDFICWIHREFYNRLPPDMLCALTESGETIPIAPGEIRNRGVTVGRHNAPERRIDIEHFLRRFETFLNPHGLAGTQKIIGLAASHHRLLWIHPFLDGNGRVARLLTTAYGLVIGLGDPPLWTVNRAFARRRSDYDRALACADLPRRNDLDGRGPLSDEGLTDFCLYFLKACLDQIVFMSEKLALHDLQNRFQNFTRLQSNRRRLPRKAPAVLDRMFAQGSVTRRDVRLITRVKQRQATVIIRRLLDSRLVKSDTPYGDLRLHITSDMAAHLFPGLT